MIFKANDRFGKEMRVGDMVCLRDDWRAIYGKVMRFYEDYGRTMTLIDVTDCIEKTGAEWSHVEYYEQHRCEARCLEKHEIGE